MRLKVSSISTYPIFMTKSSTNEAQKLGHTFSPTQFRKVLPRFSTQLYSSREIFNLYYTPRRWIWWVYSILNFFFFLSFFVLFLKKASPGRDYPPNMRKTKCILFSGILIVLFGNRKYWKKILWPLEDKYMQMTCKDIWIHVRNNHRGQDTAGFRWHKSIKPCISE